MSRRSRAREVVLQVLFEDDLNPDRKTIQADNFMRNRLHEEQEVLDFARGLLAGVRKNRAELDELLKKTADNWSLERMAVVDRNILRIGAYEMLHTDTPERVCINEAVELAKRFGASRRLRRRSRSRRKKPRNPPWQKQRRPPRKIQHPSSRSRSSASSVRR
jgi:N utilization substance protein B